MKNKLSKSKLFFILASLVFVVYFFASIPYGLGVSEDSPIGNWDDTDISVTYELKPIDGTNIVLITSEYDLAKMMRLINDGDDGYDSYEYRLTKNINIGAHYWTPIKKFKGIFDGQSYKIEGMCIKYNVEDNNYYTGFIGELLKGTIKNVNFQDCEISEQCKPSNSIGLVAGLINKGTVDNCRITFTELNTDSIIKFREIKASEFFYFGGIAGYVKSGSEIKNCHVDGDSYFSFSNCFNREGALNNINNVSIGGIVGEILGNSTIKLCSSNIYIESINNVDEANVGGIVGKTNDTVAISKSCNYEDIEAGINQSSTTIQKANIGGIVGCSSSSGDISYCYNRGYISGYTKNEKITSTNSDNKETYISDIPRFLYTPTTNHKDDEIYYYQKIVNKEVNTTITTNSGCYLGGIVGYLNNHNNITSCYNSGMISSDATKTSAKLEYIFTFHIGDEYGNIFCHHYHDIGGAPQMIVKYVLTLELELDIQSGPIIGFVSGGGDFNRQLLYR